MIQKIGVITGSRAEYGILKTLIQFLQVDEDIDLQIFVTGTHLSDHYGETINLIIQDNFPITAKVEILLNSDTTQSVAKSISLAILGFIEKFEIFKPDKIVLLGDRYESFAVGVAATHLGIHICHIHGGDMGRAVYDNIYRNSLTHMASYHFVATLSSLKRVLSMGSNPEFSFLVGSPSQDLIHNIEQKSRIEVSKMLGLRHDCRWILVLFHPINPINQSIEQFTVIVTLLQELDPKTHDLIIIRSNSDAGGDKINSISESLSNLSNINIIQNLERSVYLNLLSHTDLMIGNSSSGLIDTPHFEVPVIDVGTRQYGRDKANNVISVEDVNIEEMRKTINILLDEEYIVHISENNPYKSVNASEKIYKLLRMEKHPGLNEVGEFNDNFDLLQVLDDYRDLGDNYYGLDAVSIVEGLRK